MNIPKLHIQYAYPLDMDRRHLMEGKGLPYPSYEEITVRIGELKKVWEEVNAEDKVFKLLTEITGLTLLRDLELYVFGGGLKAMSNPLIMPITALDGRHYSDNECLETIIHEIIHRFVGQSENNEGIANYWEAIREEYKDETRTTQNHIIVYAVLEEILNRLFDKENIEDFMKPFHPEYQKAVEIVTENGRGSLIHQFRSYIK